MAKRPRYGVGLNSIRWRFAIASLILTLGAIAAREGYQREWRGDLAHTGTMIVVALVSAALTFAMASRLTKSISALQKSTEQIAAGDFESPISVDCDCEVGGLAQSFAQMTKRLNANLIRINTLAFTDGVTGLPNRRALLHVLDYALVEERRKDFTGAVLFLDLDDFKRVNDTHGHEAGDDLLREVGRRVVEDGLGQPLTSLDTCTDAFGSPCQRLPNSVVFGRFAGDEFVAILPNVVDRVALTEIGERIIKALSAPFDIGGVEVVVRASVGIATTEDEPPNASELVAFADLAMYAAKQSGKACCRVFTQQLRAETRERVALEEDLRAAIARGELVLHYQPKVDLGTLALSGVEALVRWQHPKRGLLPPGVFIDIAEKAGLMAALGMEVLQLAAAQCKRWLDAGHAMPIAVNVSRSQFADPFFAETFLETLRNAEVPPHLFSVEITESTAMVGRDESVKRLLALREAGVTIAIDDFGVGFSNLSDLSRLPIDIIKIDRSLICDVGRSVKAETILRAIVGMVQTLGYEIVAEGIETREQHTFCRLIGCETSQGYYYGRPMESRALEAWRLERERERERLLPPVVHAKSG